MTIYNQKQQEIAGKIDSDIKLSQWKDWKWQLKHSVRDVDTFEKLLGIKFDVEERKQLDETVVKKFPLSPGGGGKIRVMPQYLISWSHDKVVLRNFEGVISLTRNRKLMKIFSAQALMITIYYPNWRVRRNIRLLVLKSCFPIWMKQFHLYLEILSG